MNTTHQIITNHLEAAIEMHQNHTGDAWAQAITALALASASELPLLIEEAEGIMGRIEHDTNCKWCGGDLDAGTPPESWYCTN